MSDFNVLHQSEDIENDGNQEEAKETNFEELLKTELPKLDQRRKEVIDKLIHEQLRVEETIRIANQVILNKQEVAAMTDAEEKELAFLKSEQELERKLLLQRQAAEAREEEERVLAELQRQQGMEKLEAKELRLHQLQSNYDMTGSFRRQMQLKRDNFQDLTRKRFDREEAERKQLRWAQLRYRENVAATQELMASHKQENEKKAFLKECKLAGQQLAELQRRESEQFHEIQSLKNKMNQEAFNDEERAMEKRHSMVVGHKTEIEILRAKHHEEQGEERRRAHKTKQEMDAMILKRQQQQELRLLAIQHELRRDELQKKLERTAQDKRERHARQMKDELQEFQEQLKNLESGSYGSGGSGSKTNSSSSKGGSSGHFSTGSRSELGDNEENAERGKSDLRRQIEEEERAKRKAIKEKREKEEDALYRSQKVLSEQRTEEDTQRLEALKKAQLTVEEQLLKRHEKQLQEFDISIADIARDKIDEHEKYMIKVRMAHAKERQDIGSTHQRELEAFRKTEALNLQLRQNAIEAANSASKSKGDFLAFVCHELRNPLHGMVAIVDLIMEDDKIQIEEVKNHLNSLRQQTDLMSEIVNDVLDLSKIESGKLDLSFVDFDIIELVKSMTLDQELIIQKQGKDVELKTIIFDDVPQTIWADPVRWRQILLNILSNASKFTKKGSITVEVCVIQREGRVPLAKGQYNEARGEPQTMSVKVIDTGIGISKEELPRLFKAFSQAQPHVAREYGGTGIGLSISKALTDQMKGTIGVESVIGEGSTFTFTLPFQTGDNTNAVELSSLGEASASGKKKGKRVLFDEGEASAPKPSNQKLLEGLTVLVVDDIQLNRNLAAKWFSKAGVNVVLASTGKELVDKVIPTIKEDGSSFFDAILTDVNMPIMGGDDATRVLRSRGYKGVIIGLTGSGTEAERKSYMDAGMTTVMVKPFRFDQLASSIIDNLKGKE